MTPAESSHAWRATLESARATQAVGEAIGRLARGGDLITLIGELGAGKTQLVRGLARGMGIDPRHVSSPTFILAQEYAREPAASATTARTAEDPHAAPAVLVHVDAYRLQGSADAASMGLEDLIDQHDLEVDQQAVVAVEWADRVPELTAPSVLAVHLRHAGASQRTIAIEPRGGWTPRFAALRSAISTAARTPQAAATDHQPMRGRDDV